MAKKPKTKKAKPTKAPPKEVIKQEPSKELQKEQKTMGGSDQEPWGAFLITYGWAILIILAAIAALVYFGMENSGNITFQKCSLAKDSSISCTSFNATENTITLTLKNSLSDKIVITKKSEIFDGNNSCKLKDDYLILQDNQTSLSFKVDGTRGKCKQLTSSNIKANINITFTDVNLTPMTASGKLTARIN